MMNIAMPRFGLPIALASYVLLYSTLPGYAESTWQLAQRMMNCCFYEEAYPMFLRLVRENPNDPEMHYRLAKCLKWMGFNLRATKEFQICLDLAPDGPLSKDCRSQIELWNQELAERGPKYVLSNLDIWFQDHYKNTEYHSWDENPQPEWVMNLDEKRAKTDAFAVDVHFVSPRLANTPQEIGSEPWHAWFLTAFHDLWEKSANTATASGTADLYIRMLKNGRLEPVIVRSDGNKAFETTLLSALDSFSGNEHLKEACGKGCVIKAQIYAGMRPQNVGHWYAFTIEGPARPHLVSLDGTFDKKKGFTDLTTASVTLPERPVRDVPVQSNHEASDQAQIAKAKEAFNNSRYGDVIDYLWPLGERDIPDACLLLAQTYSKKGFENYDPRMAAIWWEKAAKLGNVEAQYKTGCIYEWCNGNSTGGITDAVRWYKVGAEHGSTDCALKLGILSEFGDAMPPNQAVATHWYRIAAAKGHKDAIRALARVH
jgi:tetratricopeptide (TPR) repeat protein